MSESSGTITRPCSVPGLDFLLCWPCVTLKEVFPASQSNSLAFHHLLKFVPCCNLLNHELFNEVFFPLEFLIALWEGTLFALFIHLCQPQNHVVFVVLCFFFSWESWNLPISHLNALCLDFSLPSSAGVIVAWRCQSAAVQTTGFAARLLGFAHCSSSGSPTPLVLYCLLLTKTLEGVINIRMYLLCL